MPGYFLLFRTSYLTVLDPHKIETNTVNSLMFAGINVCVFETKLCLRGLIFAVSSGLDTYLDTVSD